MEFRDCCKSEVVVEVAGIRRCRFELTRSRVGFCSPSGENKEPLTANKLLIINFTLINDFFQDVNDCLFCGLEECYVINALLMY